MCLLRGTDWAFKCNCITSLKSKKDEVFFIYRTFLRSIPAYFMVFLVNKYFLCKMFNCNHYWLIYGFVIQSGYECVCAVKDSAYFCRPEGQCRFRNVLFYFSRCRRTQLGLLNPTRHSHFTTKTTDSKIRVTNPSFKDKIDIEKSVEHNKRLAETTNTIHWSVPLIYSIYRLLHVSAVVCHHQGASWIHLSYLKCRSNVWYIIQYNVCLCGLCAGLQHTGHINIHYMIYHLFDLHFK
jgi:hypothetical protein